jgi:DNA-binding CsgD family transcriptional regulator/tetratricopeptide (TPR) repeat protein
MAGGFTSRAFIGRAEELRRLGATLDRAEQEQPQLVLLAGDAGMGKTRLLLEFAGRAHQRGWRVLVGGCVELGDIGLAYLPVVDALRGLVEDSEEADLVAEVATTAPGLGRLLPEVARSGPTGALAGDGQDQLQVFDAVRALLLRRSQRSPLVVVLEDLHWADRASRDLIAFLARTLRSGRVLLVGSYRSDELQRRHPLRPLLGELVRLPEVERLELSPFSRVELAEHLEVIAGVPLASDQLERIYERSEGNPFYAEQLLAAGAGEADVGLPSTLADVLLVRVQGLSEPAQQVLGVAAVAGRRVSHRLLAEVVGWPEADLERGLREGIGAGVLVTDSATGSYVFRHALLQEVVYADLLPSEQVRLHASYARVLAAEPEGVAAELAHHCLASHDLVGALRASIGAAQQAEAVLAPVETLRHLSSTLRLWERVPDPAAVTGTDRVELLLQAAAAANAAGERQRAAGLAEEAAATADATADSAQAAVAHERLGQYLLLAGRIEEAVRARASAVELVPAEPPSRLRARVTAAMAQALIHAGRQDEARRWCDEALTVARAIGSAEEEADVLVTQGMIEEYEDPARARSLYVAGRARAAAAGNLWVESRALLDLAWLEFDIGDLAAARAVFDEGVELAERTGRGWSDFGITMRRGQCLVRYEAGDWDDSERLAAAVPGLAPALAVVALGAAALQLEVGRGRPAAARRLRDLAALAGLDPIIDLEVAGLEADQATWQGDLERAWSAVQRGLATLDAGQFKASETVAGVWICTIGLLVQAERAERARAAGDAGTLSDAITVGHMLVERARTAVEHARVSHGVDLLAWHGVDLLAWHAKAEAEWSRLQGRSDPKAWLAAVGGFSYGYVYEVARCRWRLAEALLGGGDREEATVAAQAAHETAVRLGAAPLQAALELLARRGRLDLGIGLLPERGLVGLTPREVEVLRLLVEGRSNRQIAEQLFISGKTVSVHVTRILAKLGVHSRRDAAVLARQHGLDRTLDSDQP